MWVELDPGVGGVDPGVDGAGPWCCRVGFIINLLINS